MTSVHITRHGTQHASIQSGEVPFIHLPDTSFHAHHTALHFSVLDSGIAVDMECDTVGESDTEGDQLWHKYVCNIEGCPRGKARLITC